MRLFVALDTDKKVKEYLNFLQREIDIADVKLKYATGFHLTLKFLGDVSDFEPVTRALREIEFSEFDLKTKGIGYFGKGIRVIWAGVEPEEPVKELNRKIDEKLTPLGFAKDERFHPHVTIARVKNIKNRNALIEKFKAIEKKEIRFRVNSFILYKSTLTSQGPIYSVVEKYRAG